MSLANKKKIREERVATLYANFKQWELEGVELFQISEYQYRLIRDGHGIDYYPTSGKYFDNKFNKWGYTTPASIIYLLFTKKPYQK